ncbi:MAG: kelch repeat-containing protein [Acidobacteriaceae bacterium]
MGALGTLCFGQKFVWRERAELSLARAGYMAGVIHGKYVMAGGSYWQDKTKRWTDEVDIYDPVHDSWSQTARLPEPRSDAASVSLGDNLYLFGGGAGDAVRRDALVLHGGKWRPLPDAELPEPRLYSVAVANQGLIYVLGGVSKHDDYSSLSNKVWVWNPRTPKKGWKEVRPFPGPGLMTAAVAAFGGKIYVLGGAKASGKDVVNVNTAYAYDPQTDTWDTLPPISVSRRCWWGLADSSDIYLFGGYTSTNESDVFSYNPATRALTKIGEMPHGLCDAKFFRIGSSIYGVGGESAPGIRGRWTLEALLPTDKKANSLK